MTQVTRAASLLLAAFALTTQAFAQAPSEAQREAIKSNCRSDYIAHCSSIPPGGAASLQCLQKNMSSLSASCASAVRAAEAPAAAAPKAAEEPKAEPKTETKTETKADPAPAAKQASPAAEPKAASAARKPSQAQISAIKSNCRSDYPKVCAGVTPGGEAALQCLEKSRSKVSAACAKAVAAVGGSVSGGGAPAAAANGASTGGTPAAAAAPAAAVIVLRPLLLREELFVARSACGADIRTLCGGVQPGGGRVAQCLASQAGALSPACRGVLAQFAR